MTLTKICTKCGRELPATGEHFHKQKKGLTPRCNDCLNADGRVYKIAHKERIGQQKKEWDRLNKLLVLSHYGGSCATCGIIEPAFLTIDHVNNDGAEHRKRVGSLTVYRWLIRNEFPAGFQILCWNHNWLKYLDIIKHNLYTNQHAVTQRTRNKELREMVIDHYGGRCVCCGETNIDVLTIDHVNGGGKEHVKLIGGYQYLYRGLIDNNFPDAFRVLCRNCNCSRVFDGVGE